MDMYQKRKMRQEKKNSSKNNGVEKIQLNWFPGHMAKTKREISDKLNLIDIVYEVIDARMLDIDDLIKNKPRILIVTKYDLCDKEETNKILANYKKDGYNIIHIDLMKGDTSNIISLTNEIMNSINQSRIDKGMKPRFARVLIVGAPNVGKSTLINRLVGRKSAGVGNKPGFTKTLSWIRVNKDIELLDTPGILWPKLTDQDGAKTLAAFSSIKDEIINIDNIATFILNKLYTLYPSKLKERYDITNLDDIVEVYEIIGRKRGALSRGNIVDYEKVSNIIIRDLRNGYFGDITFDRIK